MVPLLVGALGISLSFVGWVSLKGSLRGGASQKAVEKILSHLVFNIYKAPGCFFLNRPLTSP